MQIKKLLLAVENMPDYYVAMRGLSRPVRVGIVGILGVLIGAFPVYASATVAPVLTLSSTPDVIITEFQTNGGSAAQEFVEFYNATDHDINFADPTQATSDQWKLQFFNSSAVKTGSPVWATTATASNTIGLTGTIAARDYYVLASTGYVPGGVAPDQSYDASSSHLMTDTGGGLQLLSVSGSQSPLVTTVHDRLMWLAQTAGATLPPGVLVSPGTGKSAQRIPNDDNEYVNSENTVVDFGPADTISPLDAWQPPVPAPVIAPDPESGDSNEASEDPADPTATPTDPVDNTGLITPLITELLPNPGSPLTDAADEFIELYNPNDAPFDLEGYKLEVGTTTLHSYTFSESTIIPATSYRAFYSSETGLSLTNSGGQARFRNPAGEIMSETTAYTAAADNAAWDLADGVWQWSTSPTPGLANVITQGIAATKTATATKAAATKKATAKTTAAKAKAAPKAKKAAAKKTTKKKAKKTNTAALAPAAAVKPKPPIHTGILVAVAAAAVLYGLYEYRHDISNKLYQFRDNRATRRSVRGQAAWRRGYSAE